LKSADRAAFHAGWLAALRKMAQKVDIYQSTESGVDLVIWSAHHQADEKGDDAAFFERFARANAPYRHIVEIKDSLWGFTRPSQYSKIAFEAGNGPVCRSPPAVPDCLPLRKTVSGT
jgi:hypothetical protein